MPGRKGPGNFGRKTCPACGERLHNSRAVCDCGHRFYWTKSPANKNQTATLAEVQRRRGTLNGCSKLTEDQVREIRRRYRHGMSRVLGEEFKIGKRTVLGIVSGETWGWLE